VKEMLAAAVAQTENACKRRLEVGWDVIIIIKLPN
jgi:hypothetical protein